VSKDRKHISALFYKAIIRSDMVSHYNYSVTAHIGSYAVFYMCYQRIY